MRAQTDAAIAMLLTLAVVLMLAVMA